MSGLGRARLLIVDDLADNRELLRRRLERVGYETAEADGGLPALEMIAREAFDLVLLDVMMPDLDGMEVLRRIREVHSPDALPVIMVTARTAVEDMVAALEAGANDYITKPVDMVVAKARVANQVDRKRAQDASRAARGELEHTVERLRTAMRAAEAAAKGLAFELIIAPKARRRVVGDAARLEQIIHNLLSNAVKFTQAGRIACTVTAHDDGYGVEVRDTGVGFQPELAQAVFDRFRQVDDSDTRPHGGSGLGLSISRDLAVLMGGDLTADARPGAGAVFRLSLPYTDKSSAPEVEAAGAARG